MVNSSWNKWADDVCSKAEKAYGRGRDLVYRGQSKAQDALRSKPVRRVVESMPAIQAQLGSARQRAEKKLETFRTNFHDSMYGTESAIIKLTGIYLLAKWFKHRKKDIFQQGECVKEHIVEKPIRSTVIALGLGFAIGRLLK